MVYNDYYWTAKSGYDNPDLRGVPDSTLLNRHEGYEMLYFINDFARRYKLTEYLQSLRHLEIIIREKLPPHFRSHENIRNWILQNYKQI